MKKKHPKLDTSNTHDKIKHKRTHNQKKKKSKWAKSLISVFSRHFLNTLHSYQHTYMSDLSLVAMQEIVSLQDLYIKPLSVVFPCLCVESNDPVINGVLKYTRSPYLRCTATPSKRMIIYRIYGRWGANYDRICSRILEIYNSFLTICITALSIRAESVIYKNEILISLGTHRDIYFWWIRPKIKCKFSDRKSPLIVYISWWEYCIHTIVSNKKVSTH